MQIFAAPVVRFAGVGSQKSQSSWPGWVATALRGSGVGNVCNYACRIAKREMGISGNAKYSPCRRVGIRAAVWQEGVNSPLVCECETAA